MAQQRPNTCLICHQKAYGYNYEVVSCNACKMFFRRCSMEKIDEMCRWRGKCFDGDDLSEARPRCRPCRYQKCLEMGMRPRVSDAENDENNPETSAVAVVPQPLITREQVDCSFLQYLQRLHKTRMDVYAVINICEDPTFCDLVALGHSKLGEYARPRNIDWKTTERRLKPWGSLGVLITVEVCKTLSVYNELLLSDRVLLLKNVAFKSHHLTVAFDSFARKKGRVLAPHDEEMFPPALLQHPKCSEVITELLTHPMQPLIELNITEEEYLLLNMIVICNPGIAGLSPGGQRTLSHHQQKYAKQLLNHCMLSNPSAGPSRFAAILAINQKIDNQVYITQKLDYVLRTHWDPTYYFPKIMHEACRMDNCKWILEMRNKN